MPGPDDGLGKKAEQKIKEWLDKPENGYSFDRFYDQLTGYYLTSRNICDFVCFKSPYQFYIESKATFHDRFDFTNISDFQKEGLYKKSQIENVYGLIIVLFATYQKAFILNIQDIICLENNGKKSLNIFTGPSGSGKSGILLNLAYNFAESHDKVCYVSFENDLATDAERLQEMRKTYGKEIEFDYFNYLDLELSNYDVSKKRLHDMFGRYKYVFLDSYQNVYDTDNEEGASLHKSGNQLMKDLLRIAREHGTIFFLTWQMAKGAKAKSKEEQSEEDISFSMGVTRYAHTIWIIDQRSAKDSNDINWTIKLEKSRYKAKIGKIRKVYDKELKCINLSL